MSAATASPAITGITQICIVCQDVARATAFYRDVVALPFLFESNGLAFFQAGPVRLMLSRAERAEHEHLSSMIYFATGDIEAKWRALQAAGATVGEPPHLIAKLPDREVWLAEWRDTEGNFMALMQEKPVT